MKSYFIHSLIKPLGEGAIKDTIWYPCSTCKSLQYLQLYQYYTGSKEDMDRLEQLLMDEKFHPLEIGT